MEINEELNAVREAAEAVAEEDEELSAEDLKQVAGGREKTAQAGGAISSAKNTLMHCRDCGFEAVWEGDYMDGLWYNCDSCGNVCFEGIRFV